MIADIEISQVIRIARNFGSPVIELPFGWPFNARLEPVLPVFDKTDGCTKAQFIRKAEPWVEIIFDIEVV
ncbi:MAG: hypothetical protein K9J37_19445 [Saprospiraceae bacterium]|nr:hypothetical protein [Saprospiraceae bacterium]MCF8252100.1 hypothetical protein [Saprospiraceae bacterium]MCF8282457.1 hypothetical protein [Bacteroidales bacterium]MCF8313743.1 hypothetical protein [Saprospiraceae bacterium]